MFVRSLMLGLAPILFAGYVEAYPLMPGNDHLADPKAPAGQTVPLSQRSALDQSHGNIWLIDGGHDEATATGKVNSLDGAGHTINISHQPIPSIGWPAMTMDFMAAPGVDLSWVKASSMVTFTLAKGPDGMWMIQSIKPAGDK